MNQIVGIETQADYETWRYGRARQRYRGPQPELGRPYIAAIGGSETFGKLVRVPWPAELERALNYPVANFGTPGGGPSFFLKDPVLLETLSNAKLCIIQTMGAIQNSNRLYTVRKRRNERLHSVSEMLGILYPGMDLMSFRYAHNMLHRLFMADGDKFRLVELELRAAWIARMRELCDQIETRKLLFWFSERTPEENGTGNGAPDRLRTPALVDRQMVEAIRPCVDAVVEFVAEPAGEGDPEGPRAGIPGPRMHALGAAGLVAKARELAGIAED